MEQPLDLSIELTASSEDLLSDAIATITLRCDGLGLIHAGNLLRDPLTQQERDDLRWYLEEYWKWPYLEFATRGRQVEALLHDVGKRLYHAVFGSIEATAILASWQGLQGVQHQISIVSDIPRVLNLPWELLHDVHGFLALRPDFPISIVRRLLLPQQTLLSTPFEPPLRILLVTARPEGVGFIDPRSIARELVDEVQAQAGDKIIELEFLRPPTLSALYARLKNTEHPVQILHFDGHGAFDEQKTGQGILLFETEVGLPDPVNASVLAKVLRGSEVRLAVLTACQSAMGTADDAFSSVATQLIRSGVDVVVAMGASFLVASAIRYVEALYRTLGAGVPVHQAHEQARRALYNDPNRHLHRRLNDEEGEPVKVYDWWLPHFYQQRPLILQSMSKKLDRATHESWQTPSSGRFNEEMPASPRYGFSGRAWELFQVERILMRGKLVVVHGFGGIGKTAFVREVADWLTRTNMYSGACFISFEHGGDAAMLLSTLGNYLGIYDSSFNPSDDHAALARLDSTLKKKRILVIIDNLESILPNGDAPLDSVNRTKLWGVLLGLARMRIGILLTSRDTSLGDQRLESGKQVAYLKLGGLDPENAYILARRQLLDLEIDHAYAPYTHELRNELLKSSEQA